MKRKLDLHTHILPEMDDGAQDVSQSLQLLQQLQQQQVTDVYLTPHYYSHRESLEDFLSRREQAMQRLQYDGPLHLALGAELYLSPFVFNNRDLSALCYPDTRIVLVEMPYDTDYSDTAPVRDLLRLQQDFSVRPLLAHIERYPSLLSRPKLARYLLEEGCLFQVNACALAEKHLAKKLLPWAREGLIHAFGSDCHHPLDRPALYQIGEQVLEKWIGNENAQYTLEAFEVFPPQSQEDDCPYLLFP